MIFLFIYKNNDGLYKQRFVAVLFTNYKPDNLIFCLACDQLRIFINLLFEKARVSFYGSLLAGTVGITMNCVGFGMMYFGKTDVGFPTAVGGFGLEACSYFVYKVSQDSNDRLDSYFGNERCEDEDTEESES